MDVETSDKVNKNLQRVRALSEMYYSTKDSGDQSNQIKLRVIKEEILKTLVETKKMMKDG